LVYHPNLHLALTLPFVFLLSVVFLSQPHQSRHTLGIWICRQHNTVRRNFYKLWVRQCVAFELSIVY